MGTTATMGHATMTAIGLAAPTDKQLYFKSNTMKSMQDLIDDQEITGSVDEFNGSVVPGVYRPSGTLVIQPRPDNLALLMQLCMGGTPSGNNIALAATLPSFYMDVKWGTTKARRFATCYVNRWTLSSRKNEKLSLSMEIHAASWTDITFPSITASLSTKPAYAHHQATLSLRTRGSGSLVSYKSPEFTLEVNNNLDLDRFENAQARVEMPMNRRQITLSLDSPYVDATSTFFDIYGDSAVTGVDGTLVWANGSDSLTYSFPCGQKPGEGPGINDDTEIRLPFTYSLREIVGTPALACVNVSA